MFFLNNVPRWGWTLPAHCLLFNYSPYCTSSIHMNFSHFISLLYVSHFSHIFPFFTLVAHLGWSSPVWHKQAEWHATVTAGWCTASVQDLNHEPTHYETKTLTTTPSCLPDSMMFPNQVDILCFTWAVWCTILFCLGFLISSVMFCWRVASNGCILWLLSLSNSPIGRSTN